MALKKYNKANKKLIRDVGYFLRRGRHIAAKNAIDDFVQRLKSGEFD